ncbi:putative NPP1 domain protein [Aspergillus varians]
MSLRAFLVSALAAVAVALPTEGTSPAEGALVTRDVVNYETIVGFRETVPKTQLGKLYKSYRPYLDVVNGCLPYPAVDAEGNTSGGVDITLDNSTDCSNSKGQVYVRGHTTENATAIMYAWYMPKDSPSAGMGHRHEWEGVIVWLSSPDSTAKKNILAVCPSGHGGWDCSTDGYSLSGSHSLIKYQSIIWPINHQCFLTDVKGKKQPLIAWESLPEVAREALETTDFGAANVPFNDRTFLNNLAKATFESV